MVGLERSITTKEQNEMKFVTISTTVIPKLLFMIVLSLYLEKLISDLSILH